MEQLDYECNTVAELKSIAENQGLKVTSSMKKADIIEVITKNKG